MSVCLKTIFSLGNLMFQNVYLCRLLYPKNQLICLKMLALSFILSSFWFNISKTFQNVAK